MNKPERSSKKIVFVNQSTGYLSIDIINQFAREYDVVHLLYGEIRVQDFELDAKVTLTRIFKKSRKSHLTRFFAWMFASIQIFFLLLFRFRHYEIFYFSLPPFAYLSSLILSNRFSILIFDVYPDVLKMLGITQRNLIWRFWSWANRRLFARAHCVFTIGEGLARLMAQYVSRDKIHVVPLWSGLTDVKPIPQSENPFVLDHQMEGKFIVQYSGNIGGTHNIETLVEVARRLRDDDSILFVIIGRGLKVPLVAKMVSEYRLTNCKLLPFQPDNMIRYSLAAADISVVLIEDQIAEVSVPSKIYNLLGVGSSILAIAPPNAEVNQLIQRYGIGACFSKNQIDEITDYIKSIKASSELSQHRQRALLATKDFTMTNAQKYLEIYQRGAR